MILVKVVKAKRFNDKGMREELYNGMRRMRTKVLKDYEGYVKTWEHKPKFIAQTHITARTPSPSLEIYPDPGDPNTEIYGYVEQGTKPHAIWAGYYTGKSKSKVLAFPSIFSPKTKVGSMTSGAGKSGGETIFRPYVQHPGTEGRHFDELIIKKWRKPFIEEMELSMKRAVQESGHGK